MAAESSLTIRAVGMLQMIGTISRTIMLRRYPALPISSSRPKGPPETIKNVAATRVRVVSFRLEMTRTCGIGGRWSAAVVLIECGRTPRNDGMKESARFPGAPGVLDGC